MGRDSGSLRGVVMREPGGFDARRRFSAALAAAGMTAALLISAPPASAGTCPDGSAVTISGTVYCVVTFTSVGSTTWTAPSGVTQVEYLVVAGGGGGGSSHGGGGGAGGLRTNVGGTALTVTPATSYAVTVGAGGAGGGTPRVASVVAPPSLE